MLLSSLLAAATFTAAPPRLAPGDTAPAPATSTVTVTIDSAQSRVIITAGPFHLPDMSGMKGMDHMDEHMGHGTSQMMRFEWPVDGWMRGFRVDMTDAAGKPLPSTLLHHLIGVNYGRRQLVYHAVERLFGWGSETDPVELPKSLGVPLERGAHLGMYAMFHNETGRDVDGAYLRVTLLYTPKAGNHPVNVLPLYIDVNNVIGGVTTFDIPPGKSTRSYEFELPTGVRVIGVGGHLHDYGVAVRLEDAETGKVLVRLKAKRDAKGHVTSVGRFIFGFNNDALHLLPHHRYRVVGEYDNPTGEVVKDGGMAHINGAIIPDDIAQWPALDPNDPLVQKDLATLPSSGGMTPHRASPGSHGQHPGMNMNGMPMDHMNHHAQPDSTRREGAKPDSTKRIRRP